MDTWGSGDAKVSVGDTVMIWHQHYRRGAAWTSGEVVKIGTKLLHVSEGVHSTMVTFYLEDQQKTGEYSGEYRTLAQHQDSETRRAVIEELASLDVTSSTTYSTWDGWTTDQLIKLEEAVSAIRA